MALDIPHVSGLVKELSDRIEGEIIVEEEDLGTSKYSHLHKDGTNERIIATFPSQIGCYLFRWTDRSLFGTLYIRTYTAGDIVRIASLKYEGQMPGYQTDPKKSSNHVLLEATENPLPPVTSLPNKDQEFDLTQVNNTPEEPLYRHDCEKLSFADHEIDGVTREIYFKEEH